MKKFLALLLALCLSFALVACSGGGGGGNEDPTTDPIKTAVVDPTTSVPEDEKKSGGFLELSGVLPADITWYNQRTQLQVAEYAWVAETLCRFSAKGDPELFLLESLTPNSDELYWEMKVKDNIYFTDGSKLTAEVVAWNMQMYKDYGVLSTSYYAAFDHCEVIDELTLRAYYTSWDILLPYYLSRTTVIVSKQAYDEKGMEWLAANPVGTGPFTLEEHVQDVSAKFVKNPNYWRGEPYLDGINLTSYTENLVLVQAFQDKQVDAIKLDSYAYVKQILDSGYDCDMTMCALPLSSYCYNFNTVNTENNPVSELKVRQAIAYAINADEITAVHGQIIGQRSTQWCLPTDKYYNEDITGYPYDPEKARSLLAEAGYPDGFDLNIWCMSMEDWTNMSVMVKQYLSEVGINATIQPIEPAAFVGYIGGWPDGMFLHTMGTDCGAATQYATTFVKGLTAGLGVNAFAISDELSELTLSAKYATDADVACDLFKEVAYEVFEEQCLIKNIYLKSAVVFEQKYVMDSLWSIEQNGRMDTFACWLDK